MKVVSFLTPPADRKVDDFPSVSPREGCLFWDKVFTFCHLDNVRDFLIKQLILPSLQNPKIDDDKTIFPGATKIDGLMRQYKTIKTADAVDIDAFMLGHPKELEKSAAEQKWIVYFNGNGCRYEQKYDELIAIAKKTGANLLTFNYRGVGKSKGSPKKGDDLVRDGEAAVQYLIHSGIPLKNILIHGWSLGGGVGAQVAANHHGIHFCSDRSFASFPLAAEGMIDTAISHSFLGFLPCGAALIYCLRAFVHTILEIWRWDLDSQTAWNGITGHKWAMYHEKDKAISYKVSSLHHNMVNPITSIKLENEEENAHGTPINKFTHQFPLYLGHVRAALAIVQSTPGA